jgi:hypothetical protein
MVPGGEAMVFAAARGRALRLMRRDLRTGRDEPSSPWPPSAGCRSTRRPTATASS